MWQRTFDEIVHYLSMHLKLDVGKIAKETRLDDLGIDSITYLEVIDFIKKNYGIDLPDDSILDLDTVGALVDWVVNNRSK